MELHYQVNVHGPFVVLGPQASGLKYFWRTTNRCNLCFTNDSEKKSIELLICGLVHIVHAVQIFDHGLNRDVAYSSCILDSRLEYGRDKSAADL